MSVEQQLISGDSYNAINDSRIAMYNLLSGIYSKELTVEQIKQLKSETGPIARLNALATQSKEEDIKKGVKLIKNYFESVTDKLDVVELDLKEDYAGLFLGVRGKIQHPSESAYLSGGRIMQGPQREVQKMYRETGLSVNPSFTEPDDHVATELNFMSHLIQENAKASKVGNDEKARKFLNLQRKFLERHITQWIPRLCDDMLEIARTDFYRGIAIITRSYLRLDQALVEDFLKYAG